MSLYLIYAVPLGIIVFCLARFVLKTKQLSLLDILTIIVPGIFYSLLFINDMGEHFGADGKTLGNLAEVVFVGIGSGCILFLRFILTWRFIKRSRIISKWAFFIAMTLTFCIYIFTPALPE